jgi:hypothetical protein
MSHQNEISTHSQLEPQYALDGIISPAKNELAIPATADRLYQFAALTAGIFLLATLL